jgi:hypothetical protein
MGATQTTPHSTSAQEPDDSFPAPEYSDEGVDLTLIRAALRLTPLERLMQNDANKWVFFVARPGTHADR